MAITAAQKLTRQTINAKHGIISRDKWGVKQPKITNLASDWNYTDIVLHHSGDFGKKDPKSVEQLHMVEKGWDDVSYHYLIHPKGIIYEGRKIYHKGAHVKLANTGKIGILLMGDYNEQWWDFDDTLTKKHVAIVNNLIISLTSTFTTIKRLGGHKEFLPNQGYSCPGNLVMNKIANFRKKHGLSKP